MATDDALSAAEDCGEIDLPARSICEFRGMSRRVVRAGVAAAVVAQLAIASAFAQAPPPLPPEADVFLPPSMTTSASGGAIVDGLRSAEPGGIVTLAGNFEPGETRFEVFAQTTLGDAYRGSVAPVGVNQNTALLVLPKALPAHSTYIIWPRDRRGIGKPFVVNRTEAWWLGPRRVEAGRRFSVFGRNLTAGEPARAFVYAVDAAGKSTLLSAASANPFRIELEAPDLPAGGYDLWVHNGSGGALGWSGPLRFELQPKAPPAARIFDVREFGAAGDGVHDDGPQIERAITAAADAAPSTLYFPPGVYVSRQAFVAPSGVRWLGADARTSAVKFAAPLQRLGAPGFIYGVGDRTDVSFERLAIEGDRQIGDSGGALLALDGGRFRLKNVRLSSWGAMTLKLDADDFAIEDSDITGSGSFLSSSSQLFVARTTFRMTSDGEAAISSWGGHDIALTENRLVNADPARPDGNGIGRLFVSQPHFGGTRNLYFAGNETRDSAPRDCAAVDCNKGEQIIFEFSGVALQGPPSRIGPTAIVFPGLQVPQTPGGADVVVVAGRGLGQRRRIVSADAGALTLDRPWDVTPDIGASRFFVTPVAERAVIYGNRFEGRATHSEHDSNSTSVLLWGLCFDMVVANNDISRMRHGVMVAATSGTAQDSVAAPFFAIVENNRIHDGHNGLYTGLTFGFDADEAVTGGVGNVFRGNDIRSMSHIGIAVDTWDTRGGAISATAFERNRLRDVGYGVVSGLKLIWTRGAFQPTPPGGTHLIRAVLHANDVESRSFAFRTDGFQDWTDIDGRWSPPGSEPKTSRNAKSR